MALVRVQLTIDLEILVPNIVELNNIYLVWCIICTLFQIQISFTKDTIHSYSIYVLLHLYTHMCIQSDIILYHISSNGYTNINLWAILYVINLLRQPAAGDQAKNIFSTSICYAIFYLIYLDLHSINFMPHSFCAIIQCGIPFYNVNMAFWYQAYVQC